MANKSHLQGGFCNPGSIRLVLVLVGCCLVGYLVVHPLNWRSRRNLALYASCPPCVCDCSSDDISLPSELINSSFTDCGKNDPEMNREKEKDIIELLSEELSLQKSVANDSIQHTRMSILEARKTSSQYQKEAEKCNAGMETCEEAREKAEAALIAERKLSALWEKRARDKGWRDLRRRTYL